MIGANGSSSSSCRFPCEAFERYGAAALKRFEIGAEREPIHGQRVQTWSMPGACARLDDIIKEN
jgi:hypothetical protein